MNTEPAIQNQYFVQITPQRYIIDTEYNQFDYTLLQKININTVNLLNFSIMNAFQNISAVYNILQVEVAGTKYYVQVAKQYYGFWDIANVQTIIQTALNAQTPYTWAITLTGNQNKFSQIQITSSAQTFKLTFDTIRNSNNQLFKYLGFTSKSEAAFVTAANIQVSSFPFNVQSTQNINLQVKNAGHLNSETIGVISQIPVNVNAGQQINWQSQFYQMSRHIIDQTHKVPIQNLQLQLLDDNGQIMQIQGQNLSCTLLFEEYAAKK